jgi:hypothetical protein
MEADVMSAEQPTDQWSPRRTLSPKDEEIDRRTRRAESEAALIFALLIGACAASGIVLLAGRDTPEAPAQVSDCRTIEPPSARLACFDGVAQKKATPAKGATAPAEPQG